MVNQNVLSKRYATREINEIFSDEGTILAERNLWIAVMRAQKELGLDIPEEQIQRFEAAKTSIDLARIKEIERRTRHDVKAKIEAFVEVAQAEEHLHKGMTARALTDNVEQMQIRNAAQIIFGKYVSIARHMMERAQEYSSIILTARTHHQPAQLTTLGRRMAMWTEELLVHLEDFENFIAHYPLRGLKGPVGTHFDMLTLLGSQEKVDTLERRVAELLGFTKVLDATGQIYPRSLDYSLVSKLALISSACSNFAIGMRLMAGGELVTEGFQEGQVGSTAMPHKMNTRSSERIWSFAELLKMYADGASRLSGSQWEEGDVSCSALRRVIIPDSFYTSDGLCETTLTILNEMGPFPEIISREIDRYLQFMASTEILSLAVQSGIGREEAHRIIKEHAVAEALRMRRGEEPRLAQRLASNTTFTNAGITEERIASLLQNRIHFLGDAAQQISLVAERTRKLIGRHQEVAKYEPQPIL
ncbi:MAG: adenylosuccinate lyase [Candidatus Woesearchaeota archaeon]|nr:MAG: adenylosuccinate lyase [Candidatus Woesearchaeota archaeon]